MSHKLVLRADPEGRPDLAALAESVTAENMADWMRRRFQGQDPYWGIDSHGLESPERVFIELWRVAALGGRICCAVYAACAALLSDAWRSAPAQWHVHLLDLVRAIRPESCRETLRGVLRKPDFTSRHVQMGLDRAWLHAAAAYRWFPNTAVDTWKNLLNQPRYAVIAFWALAHDVNVGIAALPRLYAVLDDSARLFVLREAMRLLLTRIELAQAGARGEDGMTTAPTDAASELADAKARIQVLEHEAVTITQMHAEGNLLDVTGRGEFVKNVAAILAEVFRDNKGVNYVEFTVGCPHPVGVLVLRMQRKEGKTPAEVNHELRETLRDIVQRISRTDTRDLAACQQALGMIQANALADVPDALDEQPAGPKQE